MRIDIVVVAHSLADDLQRLFDAANADNVVWHLHLHSNIPWVGVICQRLAEHPNVNFYNHQFNRGLAKSWNDGLEVGYREGADVVMIANDDGLPGPGDVQRLAEAAVNNRDKYVIGGAGFDVRGMEHRANMQFTICAINPIAIETIGCFDENFFPIYFEDVDWYRRAALAGLEMMAIPNTCLIHMGSKSVHSNSALMQQNHETFSRNNTYYQRKWGGEIGKETFTIPFNDPTLNLRIDAGQRSAPYGAHDRTDQEIVKL